MLILLCLFSPFFIYANFLFFYLFISQKFSFICGFIFIFVHTLHTHILFFQIFVPVCRFFFLSILHLLFFLSCIFISIFLLFFWVVLRSFLLYTPCLMFSSCIFVPRVLIFFVFPFDSRPWPFVFLAYIYSPCAGRFCLIHVPDLADFPSISIPLLQFCSHLSSLTLASYSWLFSYLSPLWSFFSTWKIFPSNSVSRLQFVFLYLVPFPFTNYLFIFLLIFVSPN